jgi:putative ABC transport system permease protein
MPKTFKKSPGFARWLFSFFVDEQKLFFLSADFDEVYNEIYQGKGRLAALAWYLSHLFISLPPIIHRTIKWSCIMFENYLKIAFRNIRRFKGYSFINIAGLAMGMACCILILAFIVDELSFDRFHEKSDDIYRIATIGKIAGRTINVATVPAPMAPAMIADFPEVLNAVRFRATGNRMFSYKDKKFFESNFLYADSSFFSVFSFKLIQGDPATVLKAPFTIIITQEIAQKYFGGEEPIGKILKMDNNEDFIITGVVEKPPVNSHITFDMLSSFETLNKRDPEQMANWANWNYQTYIQLQKGINYKEFEEKFVSFNDKYIGGFIKAIGGEITNFLQPLTSIHLHSNLEVELSANSDIRYVYAFGAIALFILLIACINFMNLSTARSANRAKEVGLRKVVGAERSMLIKQFLGEAQLLAVISLLFALAIVWFVLPYFNNLAGREMNINFVFNPWIAFGMILIVLFVDLVAGSYPAFFLSGFRPVSVLSGMLKKGAKNSRFRSVLVIFQFAISITLIIGTSIVLNQVNYMKNRKLGFEKEKLLVIPIRDQETRKKAELIKNELATIDGVANVSGSRMVPGEEDFNTSVYFPEGFSSDQSVLMQQFEIDENFMETYGIELISGRNFSREITTDESDAIWINETAAKQLEWDNPVGKKFYIPIDNDFLKRRALTVIGVFKDIHHRSVHHLVEPTLITFSPNSASRITVKLNTDSITETMSLIEKEWSVVALDHPFDYFFLDDYYDGLYRSEERLAGIFRSFTIFAIFIGCLGLFGLASFAAEQRTKEIGIRKVLGSTVSSVVLILCKEFVLLVTIANLFAWPIAYFTMKNWLQSFPYQMNISIITFIIAGTSAMLIALLTVSYRALKTAWTNPIDALRYE